MGLAVGTHTPGVICIPIRHPKQITADVAAGTYKVPVPFKCRVVGIVGIPGIQGGTTVVTDLDLVVKKNTTALHATAMPVVDASTANQNSQPTLSTTAATLAIADGDYLTVDYDCTGGSSPTIDGAGADVYVVRE